MNDLVRWICERAVDRFGIGDTFNGANFAAVFSEMADTGAKRLDGKEVRAILTGRRDIEIMHGSSHFRLLSLDAVAMRHRSAAE